MADVFALPSVIERTFRPGSTVDGRLRLMAAIAVPLLLVFVGALVYATGGTQNAFLHLIYLPILGAAAGFGIIGGVATALFSGLVVLGPLMPLDVALGERQPLTSWVFRAGVLLIFGLVAGLLVHQFRRQMDKLRGAHLRHPLSDLPTRAALEGLIGDAIARGQHNGRYAVLMIDANNYDHVFNNLGPGIADALPLGMAERLKPLFPGRWQIFHGQSSKLAMMVSTAREDVSIIGDRVLRRLAEPVEVKGVPVYVDVTVGATTLGYADDDPAVVVQRSNSAVSEARLSGARYATYTGQTARQNRENMALLADVPRGLREDEFELLFQPQFWLDGGGMAGAEALLRWRHPRKGLLGPGQFLPLVEETALVNDLTRWVVRAAVRQAALWEANGHPLTVSINISPRNVGDAGLFTLIIDEVREHGIDPARIELEITESAIIRDVGALEAQLKRAKKAGMTVALDDFGDGYTSIRHLTDLPLDRLKIDRSIISRVLRDSRQARIATAVIQLAADLGMQTIAEGVEDADTESFLLVQGCDIVQGFHYSRPVAADALFGAGGGAVDGEAD